MRIAHLIDDFQPEIGYQETYLAREQQRLGHEVVVISARRESGWRALRAREPQMGWEEGIRTHRLPILPKPRSLRPVWMQGLKAELRRVRPDVVHCHDALSLSAFLVALWKRELGYTLVYDSHRTEYNSYHLGKSRLAGRLNKGLYTLFARTVGRLVPRRADAMVVIGEPERDFLAHFYRLSPASLPLIRLGADRERFRFAPQARQQLRAQWGWCEASVVLGHAGTLRPTKGIERLLEALPALIAAGADVRCLIVGRAEPAYLAQLQSRVEALGLAGRVRFEGFAPLDHLPELMSAMDIAVWPGDISITAIEAMSVGLPVVALRTSYTEGVIERYGAGRLAADSSVGALRAALEPLVLEPVLRRQQAARAEAAVEQDLNWGRIAAQFLELYRETANRPPQVARVGLSR